MNRLKPLTVVEYNTAEETAISHLPNRIVESYFLPLSFLKTSYPTRVRNESELWKYVDVMHSLRFENDLDDLMGGSLTENEFELLKRLTTLICRFTESKFQEKRIARGSLLRMLNVLRHIKYIFGEDRPRVLEIGPGCGYLGAMLQLDGYPYAATDVCQAFYLYQNHLWNFISDGKVNELAYGNVSNEHFAAPSSGYATHIPWWEFVRLRPKSAPQFDVVTINHALCELSPDSLGFLLRISKAILRGNKNIKAFIFEGWGGQSMRTNASLIKEFHRFGYNIVHHDKKITVIVPAGSKNDIDHFSFPKQSQSTLAMERNKLVRTILAMERNKLVRTI